MQLGELNTELGADLSAFHELKPCSHAGSMDRSLHPQAFASLQPVKRVSELRCLPAFINEGHLKQTSCSCKCQQAGLLITL